MEEENKSLRNNVSYQSGHRKSKSNHINITDKKGMTK